VLSGSVEFKVREGFRFQVACLGSGDTMSDGCCEGTNLVTKVLVSYRNHSYRFDVG
jgi:hypothetical protein